MQVVYFSHLGHFIDKNITKQFVNVRTCFVGATAFFNRRI